MMLALILAQIVLPWPGLDSPLVQPPGMICLGACAGPVVWGPAERGRLVVACDMRSDTCSDGRKITTTRSTPVPCEVSPGVWEMVPEDTGCYSVRGLESWAATTSYLAYGAELDRPAWSRHDGLSVAARDGAWEIMRNRVSLGAVYQELLGLEPVDPEEWTASCVMKAGTTSVARLSPQRGLTWATIQLTENWHTYSVTRTLQPGQTPGLFVAPNEDQKSILVAGCWLTRTDTPGRACWGGEAPVTCAADRHTIGTEGWPTTEGEVCVTAEIASRRSDAPQYFFDGRITSATDEAARFFISSTAGSPLILSYGATQIVVSSALAWEERSSYRVCVRRDSEGGISITRNGLVVGSASGPPLPWLSSAMLGRNYSGSETQYLNGSISSLRIRSTP